MQYSIKYYIVTKWIDPGFNIQIDKDKFKINLTFILSMIVLALDILMVHLNVQVDENKTFPPLHYIVYSLLNKNDTTV